MWRGGLPLFKDDYVQSNKPRAEHRPPFPPPSRALPRMLAGRGCGGVTTLRALGPLRAPFSPSGFWDSTCPAPARVFSLLASILHPHHLEGRKRSSKEGTPSLSPAPGEGRGCLGLRVPPRQEIFLLFLSFIIFFFLSQTMTCAERWGGGVLSEQTTSKSQKNPYECTKGVGSSVRSISSTLC